jgi:hypothetical protein
MPHTILFTDKEAKKKGAEIRRLIDLDIQDRQPQINKRRFVREVYYGHKERQLDYDGQSDIHLHVSTEKIEGLVPKLSNGFWNADPIVHVERVPGEYAEDDTDSVEKFMNWAIDADIPDFYDTFQMWVRNMLIDSLSCLKTYWLREDRNTVIKEYVKFMWRAGDQDLVGLEVPEDRMKLPGEILLEVFPGFEDATIEDKDIDINAEQPLVGLKLRVDFIEDRKRYQNVRVEFHESEYIDEIAIYIYRPIIVENRPAVEVVEFEDLIVPYRTNNLQTAERITHKYWKTLHQIKALGDSGEWDLTKDDISILETAARTSERHEQHVEDTQLEDQKDQQIGEHSHSTPKTDPPCASYNDIKLLVYEVFLREDLNGDGGIEEVIYQIPHCLEKIVKAEYLEEKFPHGRRPFSEWHHIRISDRWYGISLAELLAPINIEVNAIINMVNEAQELVNNPWFAYVPSAFNQDGESAIGKMEPGTGLPIAEKGAIEFPKFPQEPLANLSAMDTLLLFADRLTIAPQAVGSSQVRNAPRTARGTLALLSEAGIKTDMLLTAAQRGGWRELFHQIWALYDTFGPDEKFFKVTGKAKPKRITKDEPRGRYEFRFKGNSVNTNREVERAICQLRYTTLVVNPLYAMDMAALLELTKDFIKHFGEGINQDKITPKLPTQGAMHLPMDQTTEIQRILNGDPLDALPTDDHARHLETLERFMRSTNFESLEQWQVGILAQHAAQHARYLQQQIATGSLTPQGTGGQANNVPTGMTQNMGGTDLNALEGGVQ